ncbi:hypothetical protein NDU88_002753 [Pleurodeles waltl]|uniref:Secreted protein n=1 Tax=Pleurodeles waltl TaxID=8319 RepID=A0AAV7UZD9_PLEWA|nr:hypothetical protein NDU88_002753 [Pleurodeles waltl]
MGRVGKAPTVRSRAKQLRVLCFFIPAVIYELTHSLRPKSLTLEIPYRTNWRRRRENPRGGKAALRPRRIRNTHRDQNARSAEKRGEDSRRKDKGEH